jgi:hypothetical protein
LYESSLGANALVADRGDVAEALAGARPRLGLGQAGRLELGLAHGEVKRDLVVDVVLGTTEPAGEAQQAPNAE